MPLYHNIDRRVVPVFLKQGVFLGFFWGVFGMLYLYIRYVGQAIEIREAFPAPLPLDIPELLFVGFCNGFFIGLVLALINAFVMPYLASLSIWQAIVVNVLMFVIVTMFSLGSVLLTALLWKGQATAEAWDTTVNFLFSHRMFSIFAFMLPIGALLNLAREMSLRLGYDLFWKIISGSYRKPKEENRVFLFVDLATSTTIAEQLEHVRYSQLIQDCFQELSLLVLKFQASIYQFVGDEAVITWSLDKDAEAGQKAVALFFTFRKALQDNAAYFSRNYHVVPVFRGAVHSGIVTTVEIGALKREIAYHGDVLNTAARLMEISKQHNNQLTTTNAILKDINGSIQAQLLGEYLLRGKNKKVEVYGLQEV